MSRKQLAWGALGNGECTGEQAALQAGEPPFTSPPVSMDEQDRCTVCGKVLDTADVAYLILVDPLAGLCMWCLKHDQTLGASP